MPKRFLISCNGVTTDAVWTLPVAGSLKKAFPGCTVTWATKPYLAALVCACKHVDTYIVPEVKRNQVIAGNFDAALELEGGSDSAWTIIKAKADKKLGVRPRPVGPGLLIKSATKRPASVHILDRKMDVAIAAGGRDEVDFGLAAPYGDAKRVNELLGDTKKYVVINPVGAFEERWPVLSYVSLGERIQEHGFTPVVIGGSNADDFNVGVRISRSIPHSKNIADKIELIDQIDILGMAAAHVGGNVASTALASALGIPTVGIYAKTDPAEEGPYRQLDRCIRAEGGVNEITVDDVWSKLEQAIC